MVRRPWSVVRGPCQLIPMCSTYSSHYLRIAEQWWLFTFQRTERRQWGGVWGGSPPFTVYWCQCIVAFTDVFLLTQYLLCKYCTVLTSVDSNERKYCAVLTSVDSTDILCVSRILYSTLQSYIMSLLRKYCTVHYLFCKFCTVHYSSLIVNWTLQTSPYRICTPLCLSSSLPLIPCFYGGMRIHYLIVCYGI